MPEATSFAWQHDPDCGLAEQPINPVCPECGAIIAAFSRDEAMGAVRRFGWERGEVSSRGPRFTDWIWRNNDSECDLRTALAMALRRVIH